MKLRLIGLGVITRYERCLSNGLAMGSSISFNRKLYEHRQTKCENARKPLMKTLSRNGSRGNCYGWRYLAAGLICCAAGVNSSADLASGTGFLVNGKLECSFFTDQGMLFTNQVILFHLESSGKRWRLEEDWGQGTLWESGGDADYSIRVNKDPFPMVRIGKVEQRQALPVRAGTIEKGPMPAGGYVPSILWVAFVSGSYSTSSNVYPFAPFGNPHFDPAVLFAEAETTYSKLPPYPPEKIVFKVTEERRRTWQQSDYVLQEKRRRELVEPPPVGFVTATYSLLRTTNEGGLLVPLEFEFIGYKLLPTGNNAMSPHTTLDFKGTVTNYSLIKTVNPLPGLEKPISLLDTRLRCGPPQAIDYIAYYITNAWLLDTNAPLLQQLANRRRASRPRIDPIDIKHAIVYSLFCAITLLPVVIWLRSRKLSRNRRQNVPST
jgi:hypothetical protein